MRFIADDLALAQSPVSEEDLMNPITNATTVSFITTISWLFDIGDSHHVTFETSGLQHASAYGGPDKILIGNELIFKGSFLFFV
ncbi:unnamed protein product [Lactuca saligna]|uniref:Uncharacterized protein n=1 Tax=Lactuca saligna TaxID=75948 RepID=A0AA35Z0P8_LACSI|nr:unnamed protein product [Lactuca saligna]